MNATYSIFLILIHYLITLITETFLYFNDILIREVRYYKAIVLIKFNDCEPFIF